jgi:hypothetical protein
MAEWSEARFCPPIACLCGSTRFKREFEEAARELGKAGYLVFSVCWFTHTDGSCGEEAEEKFRALHYDKIRLADLVHVVNPGGYIGESAAAEIAFAKERGKRITYLEEPAHAVPL